MLNHFTKIDPRDIHWQTALSAGAGGQHINKTRTAVYLTIDLEPSFTQWPETILRRLKLLGHSYLIKDGSQLQITASESRSMHSNKETAWKKFSELLKNSHRIPKKRVATKPTLSSVEKRLKHKKYLSRQKQERRLNYKDF